MLFDYVIVIECVPSIVAKAVTQALKVPTIGIGAGPDCSGQVLVYHDLLGLMLHPHHAKHVPSFCKKYATCGEDIHQALVSFKSEVHAHQFPTEAFAPYKMSAEEHAKFTQLLATDQGDREQQGEQMAKKLKDADEYEVVKLY